ncbi:DNA translocase FtsK 4TM domain-containing protein [uncultured Umboniibacter sp.]|uniref:DNA translocase FtsK n=1 Tax=uncultured Umboniibacter sp. TaxID=1798917 RepID=UPI00341C00F4
MSNSPVNSSSQLVERFAKESLAILVIAFGSLLLVALFTWTATDPSFSNSNTGVPVQNAIGIVGARVADALFSLFGAITWLFAVLVIWRGVLSFLAYRRNEMDFSSVTLAIRFVALLITCISGCLLVELMFGELATELPFGVGGIIGEYLLAPTIEWLNVFGGVLLASASFLIGVTLFVDFSWLQLLKRLGNLTVSFIRATFNLFRAGFESLAGLIKGLFARKPRSNIAPKRAVKVMAEPMEVKPPKPKPKIVQSAPPKSKIDSARLQREKQVSIFEDEAVVGTLPTLDLLDPPQNNGKPAYSSNTLEAMSQLLEARLKEFNIIATVEAVLPGPVVTRFEIQPAAGIKGARITSLARDLARSLAVKSVRVVEIIPGKSFVGIEIPNEHRQMVMLQEVLNSTVFDQSKSPLTLALGHDISGQPIVGDLAKMPHLLVAGTTGSGKSVGINVMILSLLFKSTPDDVRLILIDPKMLELSVYDEIPHLLTPVITDMEDAENGLRWCVGEMERRYKLMSKLGVRNLAGYNRMVKEAIAAGEPIDDPLFNPETVYVPEGEALEIPKLEALPSVVVIIDEFADMMMIVGKKVEQLIARIAQKARAAGIHLILATQRPSVDVITGLIKANVPTRIAFQVSSKIDSRTILDQGGAEQLLGHGDMLYLAPGTSNTQRVHGAFVDDHEVHAVVANWKKRGKPNYIDSILDDQSHIAVPGMKEDKADAGGSGDESDPLYDEAVAFVTESRKASVSAVQRQLRVGYNRAARLVDAMEQAGVLSEAGHNGARKVLAPKPVR